MPQKKNPDGLELTRSRSALISGYALQVKSIIRSLPSGYNRDFQDTKEPFIKGAKSTLLLVKIMQHMIQGTSVNEQALIRGCKSELYATDEVLKRISEGRPFREVYKEVGMNLESVASYDPIETIKNRTMIGSSGNLNLLGIKNELREKDKEVLQQLDTLFDAYTSLCNSEISLVL